jgi:hypothetical protein
MNPTSEPTSAPLGPLSYEAAPPSHHLRVWASMAILLGGLGLVALGGCFLIGVMMIYTNGFSGAKPTTLTSGLYALIALLYFLAAITFAGAIAVIILGIRGLWTVIRSQ